MENWQNRHVRIQGDDPIVTFVSPSSFLWEKWRLRCECYNRINFFPPKPWYLYVTHTFQFFGPKNRKHDVKTERGIYLWKCPGRYFRNFILFSKIIWMMDRAAVVSLFCLRNGPPGFSTESYVHVHTWTLWVKWVVLVTKSRKPGNQPFRKQESETTAALSIIHMIFEKRIKFPKYLPGHFHK